MTSSGKRGSILACGAVALAMFAGACSGGGERASSARRAPSSSGNSSVTTSTKRSTKPSTKKTAKKKPKKSARKTVATSEVQSPGSTFPSPGAPQGPSVVVPLDGTTPTTSAPTPTTSAPTTTTVAGPRPYDPSKPIDLSGTPGVTPAEQARAEQLVRDTLRDLPKYADPDVAHAAGYRSIMDGVTGDEHFVKWALLDDGRILDSKYPESLVYEWRNGKKTLVAAMYMLRLGSTFADVPDVGGPLTQWHIHNNLCLKDNPTDPLQKVVSSLTGAGGTCPAGSTKAPTTPMLHVWIVANACGPFASLEGIGAGQVPPGETRRCDRAHGSG